MITLTRSLPATPDEFAAFAEAARILGLATIDHNGAALIASLDAASTRPSAPSQPPAPARQRRASRQHSDTNVGRVLDALEDMGGTWKGSGQELVASLGMDSRVGAQVITRLASDGRIILTKPHPRKITAITLTSARFPEADGPHPPPKVSLSELLNARDAAAHPTDPTGSEA